MRKVIVSVVLVALLCTLVGGTVLAAPPAQGGQTYTVQADDWLSKVAEKYLGDVYAWPVIWDATNAKAATDPTYTRIENPDVIEVGQKLYIPSKEEVADFLAKQASSNFKACEVTDTGGIDDKSFNATAWKGVVDAVKEYGIIGKYLESQQQTDYDKNITQFVQEKCNIIITVGFLLGDATQKYAEQNPNLPFAIVDFAYDPTIPNVSGLVFNTDEAAFLAGYLAASQTKTGKVGTWGGIAIPPVTIFMDGFLAGVNYYNQQKGTSVEVLGWNGKEGVFINNFESAEDGKKASASLADEGADILLPVAGPAGLGAAATAKERGLLVIGVDADWYNTAPEYQDVELTSILKNMDVLVKQSIKDVMDKTFQGGVIVGTLSNGGVGLAPLHNFEDKVSPDVKAELETLKADVAAGKIKVSDYLPK